MQNWIGAQADFWALQRLEIDNFQWLILLLPAQLKSNMLMLSCPVISYANFDDSFRIKSGGFTSVDGKQFEWRRIREDTTAYDVSGMVSF